MGESRLAGWGRAIVTQNGESPSGSMPQVSQLSPPSSLDRSERPGRVGLLLVLAGAVVAAAGGLSLLGAERAQPLLFGLLAVLAMAGVFFIFAIAIGAIQFSG